MTNAEALDLFDESLRRLKANYDLFFNGARKLPPVEDRRRLDQLVQEMAKNHIRDNALRFRYNTLLSRYNQYRELWGRKMRELEEGPTDYRKRSAMLRQPVQAPPPPSPVTSVDPDSYVRVGSNGNGQAMLELLSQINDANRKLGKNGAISLEQVSEMVNKQAEALRSRYNVNTIAFKVDINEGKIKLKAKPIQE